MAVEVEPLIAATPSLEGRRVVVSGGAAGLGAAVCRAVQAAGGTPLVLDIRPGPPDVVSETADLSDTASAEAAVAALARAAGGLDAVVTCAGVDTPAPFGALAAADWERIVRVNLFGTAAVVRAALPHLEPGRGRIVTVASTLGHGVAGDATAYCASKWGVVGFTRALMAECKGRLGVTLLTPGGMDTGFFDGRDEQYRPGPDAQLCDPAEVAAAVVFVLSRPAGCEVKELVVAGPTEVSWP
jgi:NAD(P)-dependent dehydrogenase (short-subunit alcohol dehydrogenase family)